MDGAAVGIVGQAQDVASRLAAVQERIAAAARRAGRDPAGVTLVAVSKTFPPERIREAIDAGVTDLGENRVQEAEEKVPALPDTVRWHLVGHLQSNKINKALELFSLIHSVDRVELGEAIGRRAERRGTAAQVLLQVNLTEKESQFGFADADFTDVARRLAAVPGLALDGLMCIAPEVESPEETRPCFRRLAALFDELKASMAQAGHPWRHLSMGMTGDYDVAVEEGATLVRVGRAIFGDRPPAAGAHG
ncbi:MAG: YggS family pyridoxal phosphate-dependent enzyme [Chloroflexota bacterium]